MLDTAPIDTTDYGDEDTVSPTYVIPKPSAKLAVWAVWCIVLCPPLAVILGSVVAGRRRKDEEIQHRLTRRRATAARIGGWITTIVMIFVFSIVVGGIYDAQARDAKAVSEQAYEAQVKAAMDASPSKGLVSEQFCDELQNVYEVYPEDPRDESLITSELMADLSVAYTALGAQESPNTALYTEYGKHMGTTPETASMPVETVTAVGEALVDDRLGCWALTGHDLEQ